MDNRLTIFYIDGEIETFHGNLAIRVQDELYNSQANGYTLTDVVDLDDNTSLAFNLNTIKKLEVINGKVEK